MKTPRTLILFVLLAALLAACGAPAAAPQSPLEANRATWAAQNVTHYRVNVHIGCFCAFRDKMPLTIEVKDGQVIAITDASGAAPSEQELEWYQDYLGAEKLFAYIEKAEAEADNVEVTYDPATGLPTQINVDWLEMAADDEMYLTVSDFEPLP